MHRLPLFPLDSVLFPGAPLPLHIFEPRYRTMLTDCLEGDERFGLVPAADGEPPPPGSVWCVAHIRASQRLPDGRSNIVVVGESRFVLERYVDEGLPYAVGAVREFSDDPGPLATPDQLSDLRRQARACLEALQILNDTSPDVPEFDEDPEALSFQVSAALEVDPATRRRLLTLRSTAERVSLLLRLLPPLLSDLGGRARLHVRARANGQGDRHFSIEVDP